MILNIKLLKHHDRIVVKDNSDYFSESSTSIALNKFKESQVEKFLVLTHNGIDNPTIEQVTRKDSTKFPYDGWYTVTYLVIPTKEYFESQLESELTTNMLSLYSTFYFADKDIIFKYNKGKISKVSNISELLEINPINTSISKTSQDVFCIQYITKKYVSLQDKEFEKVKFKRQYTGQDIKTQLKYLKMIIDLAQGMIHCGKYYELERYLTTNVKNNKCITHGCGCSKKENN